MVQEEVTVPGGWGRRPRGLCVVFRGAKGDFTLTPTHVTRETRNLNHARRGARQVMTERSIMKALMEVIADRKANPPSERSYVVDLMRGGVGKIGAKIVEEAIEVVEAGDEPGQAGSDHLVNEVADLVFHAAVLLGYRDLPWSAVENELARRFGISGIAEKESRERSS